MRRLASLIVLSLLPALASAQEESIPFIQPGEPLNLRLTEDEPILEFRLFAREGDHFTLTAESSTFVPVLSTVLPEGPLLESTFKSAQSLAELSLADLSLGTYTIRIAAEQAGTGGFFVLRAEDDLARYPGRHGTFTRWGQLSSSDELGPKGNAEDHYTYYFEAERQVSFVLTSNLFDTVLSVRGPDGMFLVNDDATEGETWRSVIDFETTEAAAYEVTVTSYGNDEEGDYILRSTVAETTAPHLREETVRGRLAMGSDTPLEKGGVEDILSIDLANGQTANFVLRSLDFDPVLTVITPDGSVHENDDMEGSYSQSAVRLTDTEEGTYTIRIRAFNPEGSGSYALFKQAY